MMRLQGLPDNHSVMRWMLLCPDFPDHVLFEAGAPVALATLRVSPGLQQALADWYLQWSELDNDRNYREGKTNLMARVAWTEFDLKGIDLWNRLRNELGPDFKIAFHSHRFSELFEDPAELSELLKSKLNA
jgi:hypothetical protein